MAQREREREFIPEQDQGLAKNKTELKTLCSVEETIVPALDIKHRRTETIERRDPTSELLCEEFL